jgi:hypothetical protein
MPGCANFISDHLQKDDSGESCSTKCVGNSGETCGGSDSVNVYYKEDGPSLAPLVVQSVGTAGTVGSWVYVGCFK